MAVLIAFAAALESSDPVRGGWSQPMRPATGVQAAPPPDLPQGPGPRATSGGAVYDVVAVAQSGGDDSSGVSAAALGATPGGFVELTELGSGRTIVALVNGTPAPDGVVLLSASALKALAIAPGAAVRVRSAIVTPQDQTALRAGAAASARIDAPAVLLTALRKRVPPARQPSAPPPVPAPSRAPQEAVTNGAAPARIAVARTRPAVAPPAAAQSGFVVQVAALSAAARADSLAQALGGRVRAGGGLFRVQLGPYRDLAAAKRGRDEAARRGYRDARISHLE